ncbi:serine/threonine protein kinase OSK1-like [Lytechinus variegatus]|uniref:serine/threonine protein kinase OSK1-like n=1 Tax=Lytechinus variegatus TaxID=7654 RepID=UPI001BB1EF71|nr:serine/threonine protein kinase OSK1-like [Lytechinus variegatus]
MASAVVALASHHLDPTMSPAPINPIRQEETAPPPKGDVDCEIAIGGDDGEREERGGGGGRDSGQPERRRRKSRSDGTVVKKKVGGYILGDVIGEGSFAKVRLGTHILTQEQVAVKVIDKKLIANREYVRKNLRREATVLQKMRHNNITRLYEVLETASNYYLVMELAEGGTFMTFLCKRRKLSERETRKYIRQLVTAVDHMHHLDVIHRDIKIENFLLDNDQNLKVIDFGLSNILGYDGLLRTQCGSPAYAAPEIFCNSSYGPAVDIWSIGVNMYAMLTGELPFVVDPPNNMTKLHSRIMQGATIPDTLTKDCRYLLQRLLEPKELDRIKLPDIMRHPWMNRGYSRRLYPSRFEDSTPKPEVDQRIIKALVQCGHHEDILTECVRENRPTPENAAYCLLAKRIAMGWGYPESSNGNTSALESDRSEMVSVLTGVGVDDAMEAESDEKPSQVVALRRPISGRGTRSMAAKEQNKELENKLKSERLKIESINSAIEKTQKNHISPTKREIQDDMRKAWSKLQTKPNKNEESSNDHDKTDIVNKSTNVEKSDMNVIESKMDTGEEPKSRTKHIRRASDNQATSHQISRRPHNSLPSKPITAPRPNFVSPLENNTCMFIVNGKITAPDQMRGRSAGRNAAHLTGKRHSLHGGEKIVYTTRSLERAKTVPAVNIERSETKNGTEDLSSSSAPDKECSMDTNFSQFNAPYQAHNAFPVHRLGNGFTRPPQAHRHPSRYMPSSLSASVVASATHPPPYHHTQHLHYHVNRQSALRRSRPHHQRSLTAPLVNNRSHSPLPFPTPSQGSASSGERGSGAPAKAVAWQDPPATVVNGKPRNIRLRQRELPNIKGFVGYM